MLLKVLILVSAYSTISSGLAAAKTKSNDHSNGVVGFDVYQHGNATDLLIAKRTNGKVSLWHQRSTDDGKNWSNDGAIPIAENDIHSPHRGSDPQIAAFGSRIVVIWTAPGNSPWGSGPLKYALSEDAGKTWKVSGNVADDNSLDSHSYADATSDSSGKFHAVWLDSRDGQQGLRYASLKKDATSWSKNATIDSKTCECCWNRLYSFDSTELCALYRDKQPRDMALAKAESADTSWKRTGRVGVFNWQFDGCPHQGGALAMTKSKKKDKELHGFVWTGRKDRVGLYYIPDPGQSNSAAPVKLGDDSAKNVDAASNLKQHLAVVWEYHRKGKQTIGGARSKDGGKTWEDLSDLTPQGRSATHPRIVYAGSNFLVFWTEVAADGNKRWRMTRIDISASKES